MASARQQDESGILEYLEVVHTAHRGDRKAVNWFGGH